jgi:ribulose-phosphate 3-epimerase
VKLAPSILSADFACLGDEVARVAEVADLLHVDVMDGHFVPNLTIGPPVVASLRPCTDLFLDCHLMVDNPGVLLDDFAKAGADRCIVHVELGDPRPLFDRLRALGVGVGLVCNPPTPVEAVLPYLDEIDLLLVMSVNPGWGGQAFIPEVLDKVRAARAEIDARGLAVEIEIDGGIDVATAAGRGRRLRHPRRRQRGVPCPRPGGRGPGHPGRRGGLSPWPTRARAGRPRS